MVVIVESLPSRKKLEFLSFQQKNATTTLAEPDKGGTCILEGELHS